MLTSNYYKIQKALSQREWQFSATSYQSRYTNNIFCFRIWYNQCLYMFNEVIGTNITDDSVYAGSSANTVTVVCGSGSTRIPTVADDDLENDNTSSFTTISTTCSVGVTNGSITKTYIRTLRNDTSSPLTISEVGVCRGTITHGDYHIYYFLIQRSLLDNPVTVAPGKTATVQIAITEGNDATTVTTAE